MSIAGVFAEDGAEGVRRALRALSYSGGDGEIAVSGPAVLGAVNGAALSAGGDGAPLVVFDGQLFERAALQAELGVAGREANDAALAGLAYRRWGETFADRLYGEFAFVLWDAARGAMFVGTDALGIGAMHHARIGGRFAFASEPRGLLAWPQLDRAFDETYIALHLTGQIAPRRTLYRAIKAVPSGHALRVDAQGERWIDHWNPLARPQMRLRDPRDYAAMLRSALVEAVEVRLPPSGLVASQLSAGLDSSAVTAIAAQALARRNRPLLAYTSVPTRAVDAAQIVPNRHGDEGPLAAKVAAMHPNIEHIRIPTDGAGLWETLDALVDTYLVAPGFIRNAAWRHALHRHAQARGAAVMFGAGAGNLTTSYSGAFGLYDLRRRRHWLAFARAADRRRRAGESWRGLLRAAWMPSPVLTARLKRALGMKALDFSDYGLMRPQFYARIGLAPLPAPPPGYRPQDDRGDGRRWRLTLFRNFAFALGAAGDLRLYGMRRADPTFDRRVVELCLAIPDEAFCLGGVPRGLWRLAIRNDLPPELLAETRRGLQASDFLDVFGREIDTFRDEVDRLAALPAVDRILDTQRMREYLDAWPGAIFGDADAIDHAYNAVFGGAAAMGRMLRRRLEADGG